ncbi:hypothetical protein F5B20DRAFT_585598 [Whalleya microplaca]|nr:hypothetical protein F5B20DRAFT_585598 [Whalleya microplaca]
MRLSQFLTGVVAACGIVSAGPLDSGATDTLIGRADGMDPKEARWYVGYTAKWSEGVRSFPQARNMMISEWGSGWGYYDRAMNSRMGGKMWWPPVEILRVAFRQFGQELPEDNSDYQTDLYGKRPPNYHPDPPVGGGRY